jgi:hypothetical protein
MVKFDLRDDQSQLVTRQEHHELQDFPVIFSGRMNYLFLEDNKHFLVRTFPQEINFRTIQSSRIAKKKFAL